MRRAFVARGFGGRSGAACGRLERGGEPVQCREKLQRCACFVLVLAGQLGNNVAAQDELENQPCQEARSREKRAPSRPARRRRRATPTRARPATPAASTATTSRCSASCSATRASPTPTW